MFRKSLSAALAGLLLAGAATMPVRAQDAWPPKDALTVQSMKGAEILAFIGVKPGDKVADVVAGKFTRAFSRAVGPTGKVYAIEPAEIVAHHPEALAGLKALAAMPDYANIDVTTPPVNALALAGDLDVVFIRQNYHDLHDKFMGPADVPAFNRAVFAALKPGGAYVVIDHAAKPGTGLTTTETLHRIDPATVKAEVLAAGFKLEKQSKLLANPKDKKDANVFDSAIRGQTDQFVYLFRKPLK